MEIIPKTCTFSQLIDYGVSFQVPYYQRNYSWESTKHLPKFWSDLSRLRGTNDKHFMGAMYFVPMPEKQDFFMVLDGQQRFATYMVFLAVLRDKLAALGPEAGTFTRNIDECIIKVPRDSSEKVAKLTLNITDKEFFKHLVERDRLDEPFIKPEGARKSHDRLLEAYEYFDRALEAAIGSDDRKTVLLDFYRTLINNFCVLTVRLDSVENAQRIFETLNDRGLQLSEADLVKNYLLNLMHDKYDDAEVMETCVNWDTAYEYVEDNFVTFLKHYLSSKKGLVRKDEILDVVKSEVKSSAKVPEFIKEVSFATELYANLIEPETNYWDDNESIVRTLKEINTLGVTQVYILIMAMKKKIYPHSVEEFRELLNFLLMFTFRYSTVCGCNPNALEDTYSTLAAQVTAGKAKKKEIYAELLKIAPSRELFEASFKKLETGPKTSRYILTKINDAIKVEEGGTGEYTSVLNGRKVHVEHILPQTPNDEWKAFLKANNISHERLVDRLGNQALILGKWNQSMKNSFFTEKKRYYSSSDVPLTKKLEAYEEWTESTIDQCQEEMRKWADKIWAIPLI